jgi:hypothetical protein
MKRNEAGSVKLFPIVLTLLVIGVGSFAAWRYLFVNGSQVKNDKNNSTQEDKKKSDKTPQVHKFQGITLSFEASSNWSVRSRDYLKNPTDEFRDEYEIFITDPSKTVTLTMLITDYTGSLSTGNKTLSKFTGIDGKTYYIQESVDETPGDNRYERISISLCQSDLCNTPINGKYKLSAHIDPGIDGGKTDVEGTGTLMDEIKEIFSTIKIENN